MVTGDITLHERVFVPWPIMAIMSAILDLLLHPMPPSPPRVHCPPLQAAICAPCSSPSCLTLGGRRALVGASSRREAVQHRVLVDLTRRDKTVGAPAGGGLALRQSHSTPIIGSVLWGECLGECVLGFGVHLSGREHHRGECRLGDSSTVQRTRRESAPRDKHTQPHPPMGTAAATLSSSHSVLRTGSAGHPRQRVEGTL